MDARETLIQKREIGELKARYCRYMDAKRWDDWGQPFTAEALLTTAAGSVSSRQAIVDMVRTAMEGIPSSHQAFLPEITMTSDVTASGIWACMFIQSEGRTTGVGHYHETYEKVDGRWLTASTDLRTTFVEGSLVPSELKPA